ncbi:5-methyltetrahydropteroyltriglutamate--homocysteine S-methyltransferase [Vagococcus sp.]|uniref:5-methyltetrahydropteroyltriglutamate-- homocysteine S-methyltransferase n=1 Tax=Vagococcus sp. TaxID=1933889 RepID=UPI003F95A5C4
MCQTVTAHYDIVGSFLRPGKLKDTREKWLRGEVSELELKKIEDQAIREVITKQIGLGLPIVSDGEFRRSYWHLDFFWGFKGVEHTIMKQGYLFHGEETRADSAKLIGRVAFNPEHAVFQEFTFAQEIAKEVDVRQSIPAPAQFFAELVRDTNADAVSKIYPKLNDLYLDIASAYHETILKLYDLGCRHLKLDDCTWGMLVDRNFLKTMTGGAYQPEELKELYLSLNNAAIQNLPSDLSLTTHICRGNYHSTWASSGGYEPIAETLFGKEEVESFFLEFDDERSGDFSPLRFVPENKTVVLGLITSKDGKLEAKEEIIKRIKEANQYIPLERLRLSPQCGFASTEEGNILTEEDQWNKIKLMTEIAKEVWG